MPYGDEERRGNRHSHRSRDNSLSPSPEFRHNHRRSFTSGSTFLAQRNLDRQKAKYRPIWSRSPSPPPSYHREKKNWVKLCLQEAEERQNFFDEFGRIPQLSPTNSDNRPLSPVQKDKSGSDEEQKSRIRTKRMKDEPTNSHLEPLHKKRKEAIDSSSEGEEREKSKRPKDKKVETSSSDESGADDSNSSSSEAEEIEVWVEKVPVLPERPAGPEPIAKLNNTRVDYGGSMMKGEAEAYAQFVQEGKRIPRRGEVGLTSDEIENFESLGFVMSGSRHKRMNAVRIRKENQIYSAEEKRAMLQLAFEERAKKENKILADFREVISQKLQNVQDSLPSDSQT
jgi:hypothetical protein